MLEEENASKRKKLEEVAALDGRTPEGARRWLQCNEKASSGGSKFKESTFNFNFNLMDGKKLQLFEILTTIFFLRLINCFDEIWC